MYAKLVGCVLFVEERKLGECGWGVYLYTWHPLVI